MTTMKYRDPGTGNWVTIPSQGPQGIQGPPGAAGAQGPAGGGIKLRSGTWVNMQHNTATGPVTVALPSGRMYAIRIPWESGKAVAAASMRINSGSGMEVWYGLYSDDGGPASLLGQAGGPASVGMHVGTFATPVTINASTVWAAALVRDPSNTAPNWNSMSVYAMITPTPLPVWTAGGGDPSDWPMSQIAYTMNTAPSTLPATFVIGGTFGVWVTTGAQTITGPCIALKVA